MTASYTISFSSTEAQYAAILAGAERSHIFPAVHVLVFMHKAKCKKQMHNMITESGLGSGLGEAGAIEKPSTSLPIFQKLISFSASLKGSLEENF